MSEIVVNKEGYRIEKEIRGGSLMKYNYLLFLTGKNELLVSTDELRIEAECDFQFDIDNEERWVDVLTTFIDCYSEAVGSNSEAEAYNKAVSGVLKRYT